MSFLDNIKNPAIEQKLGTLHPINKTKNFLLSLLKEKGFQEVDGPEIESEDFNFITTIIISVII